MRWPTLLVLIGVGTLPARRGGDLTAVGYLDRFKLKSEPSYGIALPPICPLEECRGVSRDMVAGVRKVSMKGVRHWQPHEMQAIHRCSCCQIRRSFCSDPCSTQSSTRIARCFVHLKSWFPAWIRSLDFPIAYGAGLSRRAIASRRTSAKHSHTVCACDELAKGAEALACHGPYSSTSLRVSGPARSHIACEGQTISASASCASGMHLVHTQLDTG